MSTGPSGDGFVTLADGTLRWGRFGAAGVLVSGNGVGAGHEGAGAFDAVPGAEDGWGAPDSVGTAVSPIGTLPRTGGGLGSGVLRLMAFLGFGRALLGLANRRRPAANVSRN